MTDHDQFVAIFKNRGIQYDETAGQDGAVVEIYGGYTGFYSRFTFSSSGELLKIEAFE